MEKKIIHISSRKSALALVQTNQVKTMLEEAYGEKYDFTIGLLDTIGDDVLTKHLSEVSKEQGVFTKSLEEELMLKKSRFAVHSLKDMPTTFPSDLMLAAIVKRENPQDVVIIHPKHKKNNIMTLKELPKGAVIGTSSLRREALIRKLYPTFAIKTIRGNIQTRLQKLQDHDDYDAIIVAAAGFIRGGLKDEICEWLDPADFGYGVGQGSIGIECRKDDEEIRKMLKSLEDEKSMQACMAERVLLHHIEGGCQISMGVNTVINDKDDTLTMTASLLSRDGKLCFTESIAGSRFEYENLGKALGDKFLANEGTKAILGTRGQKRAITYGNVEAPGDAAAAHNLESVYDISKKPKTTKSD